MTNIPKAKKRPWLAKAERPKYSQKAWSANPEHQKLYQSAAWRALREDFLIEHPFCKCKRPAEVVDHILPIRHGGDFWNLNNLQAMCKRCHNRKTAKESNYE